MSDRVFGGVGLLLAAFYIWQATLTEVSFISDPVGPKVFPVIIGILLAVASAVIVLRPDAEPAWPAFIRLFEIAMAVAVLVAYALLLPRLGFVIATIFATAYLSWRLGTPPLKAGIAGVATSVTIYVIFRLILGLSLASGPFGF